MYLCPIIDIFTHVGVGGMAYGVRFVHTSCVQNLPQTHAICVCVGLVGTTQGLVLLSQITQKRPRVSKKKKKIKNQNSIYY